MARLKNYRPLKLVAADNKDLEVLSAMLQDAVAKVGDIAWLPEQRRFAMVANRFVWESAGAKGQGPFARVRAGLHFDDVISVQRQNIRAEARDAVLNMLSITPDMPGDENAHRHIDLAFAGGGTIRLTVEAITAELRDISDPWVTRSRPDHKLASDSGGTDI